MYNSETLKSSEMIEKYKDLAQTYTKKYKKIEGPIKALIDQDGIDEIEVRVDFGGITYKLNQKSKNIIGTTINYMPEGHYNRVTMQKAKDGSSMFFNIQFGKSDYDAVFDQQNDENLANVSFLYNDCNNKISNLKVDDCEVDKNTTPKSRCNFVKK